MTSRISLSSSAVGILVSRVSRVSSSNPVAAWTSSGLTPGCTERSRMERSGVSKSSTARLVTTTPMSRYRPADGLDRARSYPTPDTMSTFSTKTRLVCRGIQ